MFVRSNDFDQSLSQTQVDHIINSLLVNPHTFSDIACLDGRVYGVTTACQECDLTVNYCLRNSLARILQAAQLKAEHDLGYDIFPQYRKHRVRVGYSGKIQLPHRDISAINVEQGFSVIDGYEGLAILPFVQEDITIQEENGVCVAVFSASLVPNYKHATIRDENNVVYLHQEKQGYPKKINGNWHVPIMGLASPCTSSLMFHIQHCQLIRLQFTTPECEGVIKPVYPGTQQIIPTVKEETVGDDTVFWFNAWALALPDFMDDGINLVDGEFYKLFDAIDIGCFYDAPKSPVLTVIGLDDCVYTFTDSENAPSVQIIDAENGVVYFDSKIMECCNGNVHIQTCNGRRYPAYVEIWYKTDPTMNKDYNVGAIKEAIAQWAGAELPTTACECSMDKGFIFQAQTAFAIEHRNAFTGEVSREITYDSIYGRKRYNELLKDVKKRHITKVI